MKISLVAVKDYVFGTEVPYSSTAELVQKVGAQLGAVEEVVDYGKRYDGIYVVEVIEQVKHENADKLSVCLIDDGGVGDNVERNENGLVQVVCGAPNVQKGQYVAWIPPGATVPATFDKDPFVIEKREIRGVLSNGMLASPSELGINDDHSGLLEIDTKSIGEVGDLCGKQIKELFGLDDVILDIENKMFTHRPDCFGILGVTREIYGIYGNSFKSPEWYIDLPSFEEVNSLQLEVRNEIPELVPRFMAVALENIEVKPSPYWLQSVLTRIGVKPINNVVDLTNYYSYVTAQPLHAYDYDKVAERTEADGAVLLVRKPNEGENVALLNGKIIQPRQQAIMIATDNELVGIGGVMGGTSTEVDVNTKRIIIECANFDMYSIRKTSMEHGLFTDAVTRFNKGQSPLQNDRVISKIMDHIIQLTGGAQASSVQDNNHLNEEIRSSQSVHSGISLNSQFVNERLGLNLPAVNIQTILENVEFGVELNGEDLKVRPPFWRTDIVLAEDIVEEVGRLNGFDKMPQELPLRRASLATVENQLLRKQSIRNTLSALGANEILNYSFVHGELLKKAGQDESLAFKLSNALSPELQYYRLSLTPTLLSNVHPNIKSNHDKFAIYETGKVHAKSEIGEDGVPKEFERIALVIADKHKKSGSYYQARAYLGELVGPGLSYKQLNPGDFQEHKLFQQMLTPYEPSRSATIMRGDKLVGVIGEYKMEILKKFKLPGYCAGFEVFLSAFEGANMPGYVPLSNYPSINQDFCYEINEDVSYHDYRSHLIESLEEVSGPEVETDISLIDIFQGENNLSKKRITFSVKFTSYQRTMQDEFVNKIASRLDKIMTEKVQAKRI